MIAPDPATARPQPPAATQPTREFVVKGGSDRDLWGDIDGPVDDAWATAVNALRQTARPAVQDRKP